MAPFTAARRDFCIYEHLVIAMTGLLFVGFLWHCTAVKIVFKAYSKVELAVIVANRIHPLIDFTPLIDNWLTVWHFRRKERKKNKSQRSLILFLTQTLTWVAACAIIPISACWSQQLRAGPRLRCPFSSWPCSCLDKSPPLKQWRGRFLGASTPSLGWGGVP